MNYARRALAATVDGSVVVAVEDGITETFGVSAEDLLSEADADAFVDEERRLNWVKPQGEPLALTLVSHEPRLRGAKDLFFLDPGTPVWDAVTADGQELGIVIPRTSEQGFATKLAVATPAS